MARAAIRRADLVSSKPFDKAVAVVIQRQRKRHYQGREQNHLDIVARGRVSTLRREYPCARNTTKRRNDRKDPERHGAEAEEKTCHVLRQPRNQEDHKTENNALCLDDEPEPTPDVRAHQTLNVMSTEPTPDGEGRDRSHSQPNRRIEESHPLVKDVTTQDPRQFTGNRGDDDLQGLETDENDRSQDAPVTKRVLEEAFIHVEANEELVSGSICVDKPPAVRHERSDARAADNPAYLHPHIRNSFVRLLLFYYSTRLSGFPGRDEADNN